MKKPKTPPTKAHREPRIPMTQSTIITELAARTSLSSAEVKTVFNELQAVMEEELFGRDAPMTFAIPYVGVKFTIGLRPALPSRVGRNPSTGETITLKPRPASWKLKARFLKTLKEGLELMEPPPKNIQDKGTPPT
jgi:nucleoid DNA-binding protein